MASYSSTTRANSNAGKTEPSRPSGSAVYIALHLTQTYLAHDKYVLEARGRIAELENELEKLRAAYNNDRSSGPAIPKDRQRQGWGWGF
ncbi:hypothetical protein BS47DRAFT_1348488, partial [Hydnum rufescens UP504]